MTPKNHLNFYGSLPNGVAIFIFPLLTIRDKFIIFLAMNIEEIALVNNTVLNRFEIPINGEVAFMEYQIQGAKIILVHTEVPGALQGQGIGAILVKKVMQWLKKRTYRMVPFCPYILQFLKKNPEYNSLR